MSKISLRKFFGRLSPPQADLWPYVLSTILIVQTIYLISYTKFDYFYYDDFLNFILARTDGWSLRHLTRDVQGQFAPAYRAANLLYLQLFGLEFAPVRIFEIAGSVAISFLVLTFARSQGFSSGSCAVIAAFLVFSPIFSGVHTWWSSSLHRLPSIIFGVAAMARAAQRELYDPRDSIYLAAMVLVGSLFYSKTLILIPAIVLVRAIALTERQGPPSELPIAALVARDVGPLIFAGGLYTAASLLFAPPANPGEVAGADLLKFMYLGWNEGFLGSIWGTSGGSSRDYAIYNFCLICLIIFSVKKNGRNALLLWIAFSIYVVLSTYLIGLNRVKIFGVEGGGAPRYFVDSFVYALMILISALRPRDLKVSGVGSRPATIGDLALFCLSLLIALAIASPSDAHKPSWYKDLPVIRSYVGNLQEGIRTLHDGDRVADGSVPDVLGDLGDLGAHRNFLLLWPKKLHVVKPDEANFSILESGRIVRRNQRPSTGLD